MSLAKLVLGTAGLSGDPYGRDNRVVTPKEASAVMERAIELGITAFDTAPVYGFAEAILGDVLRDCARHALVFTKNNGDRSQMMRSMARLRPFQPTFLWHNWDGEDLPEWVSGVTTYDHTRLPKETHCEYIQLNWNILRQLPPPFGRTRIARSVLLQGVLSDNEPCPIPELIPYRNRAKQLAESLDMTLSQMALLAAVQSPHFEYVIVGPTSLSELESCVKTVTRNKIVLPMHLLTALDLGKSPMTDPREWPSCRA